MKLKWISLLYICLLCFSCKDDADDLAQEERIVPKVASIEEMGGTTDAENHFSYAFVYDGDGRLLKINDKEYQYGKNGKVEHSHVARTIKEGSYEETYIEKMSYYWDEQGRLVKVVLDSLYSHKKQTIFPEEEGIAIGGNIEELFKVDIILAIYTYEGDSTLPSIIKYKPIVSAGRGQIGDVKDGEEEIIYTYENENVVQSRSFISLDIPRIGAGKVLMNDSLKTIVEYTQYTDRPGALYDLYRDLGFYPFALHKVISRNQPSLVYAWLSHNKTYEEVLPDWERATSVSTSFNTQGYPEEINVDGGEVGTQQTSIHYY